MGYVGWGTVVDQTNTETGGGADVVADVTADLPIGRGVAGSGVINTYSFFPSLNFSFTTLNALPSQITFSRGTNATLFNSSGTLVYAPNNLLTYSEQFDNAAWTKVRSSVTTDAAVAPNGASTGDKLVEDTQTGNHSFNQSATVSAGAVVSASAFFKAAERNEFLIILDDGSGVNFAQIGVIGGVGTVTSGGSAANVSGSATPVGSGWFRVVITCAPTASYTTARVRYMPMVGSTPFYTGDGTSGIYIWGAQLNIANMQGGVTGSLSTYYPTTSAAYYGPRLDYNPSTLAARGLLIEEQRTNSIRNNTMQGAVAGTPGTLPTNWLLNVGSLSVNVVGTGNETGISYVDLRFVGTTNQLFASVRFEGNTQIAAANGQTWTDSFYVRRISGSNTNISDIENRIFYRDAGGLVLQEVGSSVVGLLSNTALNVSRSAFTNTCTAPTTAFVNSAIYLTTPNGVAIDITLRIGLPQLEQGAFATSVIPTTTTALTRNADVASVNTLTPWYNATNGTLYGEYQTLSAGTAQFVAAITSASEADRVTISQTTTTYVGTVVDTGSSQASITQGTTSTNVAKIAFAVETNNFAFSANGAAPNTDTSGTLPAGVTEMKLGRRGVSTSPLSGWLRRITYYPRRLSNAELQSLTS